MATSKQEISGGIFNYFNYLEYQNSDVNEILHSNSLACQYNKMVKHTQAHCLSMYDHFVILALKGLIFEVI